MCASCWNSSSTFSTPSSTKLTAPTWMPTILDAIVAARAPCDVANAAAAVADWTKLRRFMDGRVSSFMLSLAETFLLNNRANLMLLDAMTEEQLAHVPFPRARSIADQFAH